MLSFHSAEVIAFATDGDIVCRDCAERRYTSVGVAKIEQGIGGADASPISRYELESYTGESNSEYARQEAHEFFERLPSLAGIAGAFDRVHDRYCTKFDFPTCCGGCGEGIE